MADTSLPDPDDRKPLWEKPFGRVAFWVSGVIAVIAAIAALLAAGQDGGQGFIYLSRHCPSGPSKPFRIRS